MAVFLVGGVMILLIWSLISSLKTGVIDLGPTAKLSRQKTPTSFWTAIVVETVVVLLFAIDLIWMRQS
jgi:hypothetical protein